MLDLLSKIGWLKVAGVVIGVLFAVVSAAYWKGCSDGTKKTEKEYQAKLDESELKYQRLLNAPPKIETRTVTVYVKAEPTSGMAEASPVESAEENPLAIPKRTTIHVDSPGDLDVTFYPLELPVKQFQWYLEPAPMKVDTVYITETKTAIEYVEKTSTLTVVESAIFGIGAGNFIAGGRKEITIGALGAVGLVEAGKYIFGGK